MLLFYRTFLTTDSPWQRFSITIGFTFSLGSPNQNFKYSSLAQSRINRLIFLGKPVISELTDETCRIDWTPPQSNGGSPVTGYAIERKRAGAGTNWCRVASNVAVHNCTLRRLVDGASYNVRVIAVSAVGESECSQFSESFTPLAPSTPVTGFKTGKLTDNSIELKWVIPEEIGAAGIDGYVFRKIWPENIYL